jgi:hypothetical protein
MGRRISPLRHAVEPGKIQITLYALEGVLADDFKVQSMGEMSRFVLRKEPGTRRRERKPGFLNGFRCSDLKQSDGCAGYPAGLMSRISDNSVARQLLYQQNLPLFNPQDIQNRRDRARPLFFR